MFNQSTEKYEGDILPGTGVRKGITLNGELIESKLSLEFGPSRAKKARYLYSEEQTDKGLIQNELIHEQGEIASGSHPRAVTIKINGIDCTKELGGPFYNNVNELNVIKYVKEGFNEIELQSISHGWVKLTITSVTNR